jgi:hypothetical protein
MTKEAVVIDVREAVLIAKRYLADLYNARIEDMNLEEIEIDGSDSHWLITISFFTQDKQSVVIRKEFKILKIEKSSGNVIGMKIRTFR